MSMFFELWDVESGNILGDFDSRSETLRVVNDLVAANGTEYGEALSPGYTGEDGRTTLIAEGTALMLLTDQTDADRTRRSA